MAEAIKAQMASIYRQTAVDYGSQSVVITAQRLVQIAALQAGEAVLDIATGTGLAALPAAAAVAPGGTVDGLDISPEMLARARQRTAGLNLDGVRFHLGDAEDPPFPPGRFDAVLCASAIFLLPDPPKALRAWRRCLRPGGRVLFSTWARGNNAALAAIAQRRQGEYGIEVVLGPSPVLDPEAAEALLVDAGFTGVRAWSERHDYTVPDAEQYWKEYSATHARPALAALPPERLHRFKQAFLADVAATATPEGIPRVLAVNFATGMNPG